MSDIEEQIATEGHHEELKKKKKKKRNKAQVKISFLLLPRNCESGSKNICVVDDCNFLSLIIFYVIFMGLSKSEKRYFLCLLSL